MTPATLQQLVTQGESETLELKRSTAELRRVGETLGAFLNGEGGLVLVGVGPDGRLVGQHVSGPEAAARPGRHQAGTKQALGRLQVEVLEIAALERSLQELMVRSGRTDRTKFRDEVLRPLIDAGLLELTIPDKPRSPQQRYRTTVAGQSLVTEHGK